MTSKPNPAALRRRAGSQAYLLAKYEEVGTLREAFRELVHLHDREPDSYRDLTGSDRLPEYETFRRYWKEIPLKERRSAKQRYLRRS
jgi:hypothetical protein